MAGIASRMLNGASQTWTNVSDAAQRKLLMATPTDLLDLIDNISSAAEEFRNPTTPENLGRAIQADAIGKSIQKVYLTALRPGVTQAIVPEGLRELDPGRQLISSVYKADRRIEGRGTPSKTRIDQLFSMMDELSAKLMEAMNKR